MKFFLETVVLLAFAFTAIVLYVNYWDDIRSILFSDEEEYAIYLGDVALKVTVADEYDERIKGLSGTPMLGDLEGKLFIFDEEGKHGIWMKDMIMPIDILWIDKNLQVIHIEENVLPSSYPATTYYPQKEARFVLEMNAFFVSSLRVQIGDRLTLPPALIPDDVKVHLRQ